MPRARVRLGQVDLFTKRVRAVDYRRSASEFQLACSVADMLRRWCQSGWMWSHFPAGEERPTNAGRRLQRMGLKSGWPDYLLYSPSGRSHFLELKRAKRGVLSDEQKAFRDWAREHHYPHAVVDSVELAIVTLRGWGALRGIA